MTEPTITMRDDPETGARQYVLTVPAAYLMQARSSESLRRKLFYWLVRLALDAAEDAP